MFKKLFGSAAPAAGPVNWLVVGLGNPGREYEQTRHNAGFIALDYIAREMGIPLKKVRFKSWCGDGTLAGQRVLLLKPSTYMNNSGEAVGEAASFYKIPPERIVILFDDVSLEPGAMRIRRDGSAGGHNGIKSILQHLGSDAFPRVKIGVGQKPNPSYDMAAWVLGKLSSEDTKKMEPLWDAIYQSTQLIVGGDIAEAMNRFNGR
ncbi:aminoacyl-tRNA hydrolase [Oscillospiraceae bacterium MB08-C2-2]|nr:aminoacyl-tRNA hydrolase [Oscillospiraceae bacterium MB08-C2-2]